VSARAWRARRNGQFSDEAKAEKAMVRALRKALTPEQRLLLGIFGNWGHGAEEKR
jgi:hypothetical protein